MGPISFLLAAALVAVVTSQSLTCLNAAGANAPTAALAQAASQLRGPVSPQDGITTIFNILPQITTSYFQNFYFGVSNGDAFLLKNCRLQESTNIPYCGQANTPLIAYIRSQNTYGDTNRHVWAINPQTGEIQGSELASIGPYDTVNRPWYQQGLLVASGWTALEQFAAGGSGRTYTVRFDDTSSGGIAGVAAWDRPPRTPCDVCLTNSWSVTAATVMAASDMRRYVSVTSAGDFQRLIFPLWNTMLQVNRGNTLTVYVGLANNDFYQVTDCWASINMGLPVCTAAGTRYYAAIRNSAVFGDTGRHFYSIATDGTITQLTGIESPPYMTTQRPWFILTNGWTDPYASFSTGATISTYTVAIATGAYFATTNPLGVVGSDTTSAEPCQGWTYVCPSTTPTASPSWTMTPTPTKSLYLPPLTAPPADSTVDQAAATKQLGYGLGLGLGIGLGLPLIVGTLGLLYLMKSR